MSQDFTPQPGKKLPDELKTRLFEQFDSLTRNFKVTFGALTLFGLIFFYLIFAPVVSINSNRAYIIREKKGSDERLKELEATLDTLSQVKHPLFQIEVILKELPAATGTFLEKMTQQGNGKDADKAQIIRYRKLCTVAASDSADELSCLTLIFLNQQLNRNLEPHRDSLLALARKVNPDLLGTLDTLAFKLVLSRIEDSLKALASDPTLFELEEDEPLAITLEMERVLRTPLKQITQEVDNLIKNSDYLLRRETIRRDSLNDRMEFLSKKEKEIGDKIDKVEFPLGSIPVSLRESIEIFPILLTIGIILSMFLYRSLLDVRSQFIQKYLKPLYPTLDQEDFANTMPVFLNPDVGLRRQWMPLLYILLPLLIFCGTLFLSVSVWDDLVLIRTTENEEFWLYQEVFTGLIYLACILAYFFSYVQLLRKFRWRMETERRRPALKEASTQTEPQKGTEQHAD